MYTEITMIINGLMKTLIIPSHSSITATHKTKLNRCKSMFRRNHYGNIEMSSSSSENVNANFVPNITVRKA